MRYLLASLLLTATLWGQAESREAAREAGEVYNALLEDPRDPFLKPDEVVKALNVGTNDTVATIEADGGYFARRFSAVAKKVYVVSPHARGLNYAKLEARDNVDTVQSTDDNPEMGAQSVDLVFVHDNLHRLKGRSRYYGHLASALRSGGRLVIIDRKKHVFSWFDGGPPITQTMAGSELKLAGFKQVQQFTFLPYQYFVVYQKQ
jgi:SAM-dependent methyltransferase